jgi:SAM-dependent methyltransferase
MVSGGRRKDGLHPGMEDIKGRDVIARESRFWDSAAAWPNDLNESRVDAYIDSPMFRALLQRVGDLRGKRVLDICCGRGVSTCALAHAGAELVVGLDISSESLAIGQALAKRNGYDDRVRFVQSAVEDFNREYAGFFDIVVGTYALHHLDLSKSLPNLRDYLHDGGHGMFLETMGLNPVLSWSRRWLVGRFGIPRYGTLDEHPLTRDDLAAMRQVFGDVQVLVDEVYAVFGILDRQVFHYQYPAVSRFCHWADDRLKNIWPNGSYHALLYCRKVGSRPFA